MTDFKNVVMNERLYGYMLAQAQPPNAIQAELIARTRALGESAQMQIPHEQAVLLTMLVRLTNAERIVEVCTYIYGIFDAGDGARASTDRPRDHLRRVRGVDGDRAGRVARRGRRRSGRVAARRGGADLVRVAHRRGACPHMYVLPLVVPTAPRGGLMYNTEPTAIAPGGVALSTEDPATSPTALGSVSDGELSAMRQAVALSRLSLGETSPNPNVGCVLLDERGEVVGQGRTAPVGGPHAEVNALAQAGQRARGGTAVVTLEPCDHTGRTGPCTGALLASGVRRVVYAVADPNPVAAGGATTLRAAGVEVVSGVLEPDARAAMLPWLTSVSRGRPFVVWRFATTLDGRIAARDGTSKWITSAAARAEVPDLLAEVDAVIASAGTVRADDPQLTARYPDGSLRPRQPLRVVLAGAGGTPRNAKVTDSAAPTWIVEAGPTGRVDLHELMKGLYDRGVRYALVEGDPTLAGALLGAGLVDRVIAYRAPAPLGAGPAALDDAAISTIGDALRFDLADVTMVGPDVGLVASPRSKAE